MASKSGNIVSDRDLLKKSTLDNAIYSERWAWLVRASTDIGSITTWDPNLLRDKRILVPIDVQAYFSNETELLTPVTGGPNDPAPFSEGSVASYGVHLHWAMPDALLRGQHEEHGDALVLPKLPDRWVVLRLLFPNGHDRPMVRGWVIDAKTKALSALKDFNGSFNVPTDAQTFDPLNGGIGGSLLWTASYHASAGRFGFHDPLDDINILKNTAKKGFHNDIATYLVCGWNSTHAEDPLNATGKGELFDLLQELRWFVDPEQDEDVSQPLLSTLAMLQSSGYFQFFKDVGETEIHTQKDVQKYKHADIIPESSLAVSNPGRVIIKQRPPRFSSMLHGMVTGVPINAASPMYDERPNSSSLSLAIGFDTDDVVTALGASTLGTSISDRQTAETIAAAFTSDLMDRLGEPDGLRDIAEKEHSDMFWSSPGKPLPLDREDVLRVEDSAKANPVSIGRKARSIASVKFSKTKGRQGKFGTKGDQLGLRVDGRLGSSRPLNDWLQDTTKNPGESRSVRRPAPRLFRPQAPVVAIKGCKPSLRHHHDGSYDDHNRLRCRYPSEVIKCIDSVVDGVDLVPSLNSGAVPNEVLLLAREAAILTPYAASWLAKAVSKNSTYELQFSNRIQAEMLRMYSLDGRYDGTGEFNFRTSPMSIQGDATRAHNGNFWEGESFYDSSVARQLLAELSRMAYLKGTPPSPIGITAWRQPWVPLWLEWRVQITGWDNLDRWTLEDLDFKLLEDSGANKIFQFDGRSPINRGLSTALHSSIQRWITAEQERDATEATLGDSDKAALEDLADFLAPLDLVSTSLDGIREQLLGLLYQGGIHTAKEEEHKPTAHALPVPLFGGKLKLLNLRLVDAFGRTQTIALNKVETTTALEVPGEDACIRMHPRIQNGARWLFRLVSPSWPLNADAANAPEAFVNQIEPKFAINPVAGFLLPDHIDEALEFFDVDGNALGQLSHHEISGAVRWEPAPGRAVPPTAGPSEEIPDSAMALGLLAEGVVRSDVRNRATSQPDRDSALSALLRTIDTALWTIDTYSSLGTSAVAGLVGRPIAVVKATLRLDIPDDIDSVKITHIGGADARRESFESLRDQYFPVRFGDLHRSDDSLLGFYVNENYDEFYLVDKVLAEYAKDSGRCRGHLGPLGSTQTPETVKLTHPLLKKDDTIYVRPGQVIRLTLLMLPAGRVHLTSGVLPKKSLSLNDAWITKGLTRVIPSVRVGPVLVDPEEIRLPKVNLLGEKQQFTRRTGPLTWRDDPIVSATDAALLPTLPHEIQEGWIRIIEGE
ncbi:MAG: hypothetical protein OEZ43_07760 [Gammaproteobacteria bacterium]|nr:hypothetical protein [Gammaproteobacteria bacterium]